MSGNDARADKQDIAEVLLRYATGIDRRDWALFRACFVEDMTADYDGIATFSGVDEIADFMESAHADMGHTMHQLSNLVIEVTGDVASSRTYVDGVLTTADGSSGLRTLGFYDDELLRTVDGWRIAHRRFTSVHVSVLES